MRYIEHLLFLLVIMDEYIKYLHTFKQKYQTIHLNFHALEGQIVFYDPIVPNNINH